jgi:hypothetical protein
LRPETTTQPPPTTKEKMNKYEKLTHKIENIIETLKTVNSININNSAFFEQILLTLEGQQQQIENLISVLENQTPEKTHQQPTKTYLEKTEYINEHTPKP